MPVVCGKQTGGSRAGPISAHGLSYSLLLGDCVTQMGLLTWQQAGDGFCSAVYICSHYSGRGILSEKELP